MYNTAWNTLTLTYIYVHASVWSAIYMKSYKMNTSSRWDASVKIAVSSCAPTWDMKEIDKLIMHDILWRLLGLHDTSISLIQSSNLSLPCTEPKR